MTRYASPLILALLALPLAGCGLAPSGGAKAPESVSANSAGPAAPARPAAGDAVVAPWVADSFYQGKLVSVDGSKATVDWDDESETSEVDFVDVFLVPRGGDPVAVKAGDFVLARSSPDGAKWYGAEVTGVSAGVVAVRYASDGTTDNLAPEKVIAVSPSVAANVKAEAEEAAFLKRAREAGRPASPDGYAPKPGDRVLAEWTEGNWHPAKVRSVSGDKATVAYDGGMSAETLELRKVVLHPSAAEPVMPSAGGYAVVSPGGTGGWDYALVSSVNGTSLEVKMADGETKTVKAGDFAAIR